LTQFNESTTSAASENGEVQGEEAIGNEIPSEMNSTFAEDSNVSIFLSPKHKQNRQVY